MNLKFGVYTRVARWVRVWKRDTVYVQILKRVAFMGHFFKFSSVFEILKD